MEWLWVGQLAVNFLLLIVIVVWWFENKRRMLVAQGGPAATLLRKMEGHADRMIEEHEGFRQRAQTELRNLSNVCQGAQEIIQAGLRKLELRGVSVEEKELREAASGTALQSPDWVLPIKPKKNGGDSEKKDLKTLFTADEDRLESSPYVST